MQIYPVRFSESELRRIEQYAHKLGLKKSVAIKGLISLGLQDAEKGLLDVRELIPDLHSKLTDLQRRQPRSAEVFPVLTATAIEAVNLLRQLVIEQDPKEKKLLLAARRNTKTELEALVQEGTL